MASLYLMRHGQASFNREDYDQLSDLGILQAKWVGEYCDHRIFFDKVYTGDMRRHLQTKESFFTAYRKTPQVAVDFRLNEFDHKDIISVFRPAWNSFQQMNLDLQKTSSPRKAFQKVFEQALSHWVEDEQSYKETWSEFHQRVNDCIAQIRKDAPKGSRTLIITSGGVIASLCRHILGTDPIRTLALNSSIANGSLTKIVFSDKAMSLSYFNNYIPIEINDIDCVTYR